MVGVWLSGMMMKVMVECCLVWQRTAFEVVRGCVGWVMFISVCCCCWRVDGCDRHDSDDLAWFGVVLAWFWGGVVVVGGGVDVCTSSGGWSLSHNLHDHGVCWPFMWSDFVVRFREQILSTTLFEYFA